MAASPSSCFLYKGLVGNMAIHESSSSLISYFHGLINEKALIVVCGTGHPVLPSALSPHCLPSQHSCFAVWADTSWMLLL